MNINTPCIYLKNVPVPFALECTRKNFKENEFHVTRVASHFVIIFMLKNILYFHEEGKKVELQQGEWYIQPKSVSQTSDQASPNAQYYYIHFFADCSEDSESALILPQRGTYDAITFLPYLSKLERFTHEMPLPFLEVQTAFLQLLSLLNISHGSYDSLVFRMMHFLDTHYPYAVTSQTLAEEFNYTREYLEKKFKKQTGVTPHNYLTKIRLEHACNMMLSTDIPIQSIAFANGFSDVSVFYKAFKHAYQVSPSTFRQLRKRECE